jgi:hypothetical protein
MKTVRHIRATDNKYCWVLCDLINLKPTNRTIEISKLRAMEILPGIFLK